MIQAGNLCKKYGSTIALDKISFSINKDEIVGFLGPNGAGKSTALRILTCFMPATSGKVKVHGYDVFHQSMEVRKVIGYLPENVPLYQEMRVSEYLDFRAKLKNIPKSERKKSIEQSIEKCWIGDVRNKVIGHLSKGYRQRVGLADSLLHNPPILILDEPTVGLDPNQIRKTRALIQELGKEHTILLSTHILPEAEMICDRVLIINKGIIIAQDKPAELRSRLKGQNKIVFELKAESADDIVNSFKDHNEVVSINQIENNNSNSFKFEVLTDEDTDFRANIFNKAVEKNWILLELTPEKMSLEDIFVHITTSEDDNIEENKDKLPQNNEA